jgi:ABC-type nitrate/sulfonate/bicarbonate transport system substrate-binding protein
MIAGYMNTLPYSIVAGKGITKFEQLKGTKAAISRFGSTSDLAMRFALERNGLVPNKDVTISRAIRRRVSRALPAGASNRR